MTDRPAAGLWLFLRSLAAVLTGFILIVMTHTGTDELLHSIGVIPRGPLWDPWLNLLALTYRCVFSVAGGFVTAWLAPRARMRHVLILAVIGTFGGIAGVLMSWNLNLGPKWYPIALAVTAFPTVWLGGWLLERRYGRV